MVRFESDLPFAEEGEDESLGEHGRETEGHEVFGAFFEGICHSFGGFMCGRGGGGRGGGGNAGFEVVHFVRAFFFFNFPLGFLPFLFDFVA